MRRVVRSAHPPVVGLDLSYTGTGVAVPGAQLLLKTEADENSSAQEYTTRALELRDRILRLIPTNAVVFIEDYAYGASSAYAHEIGALGGVVRAGLTEARIPWTVVKATTIKKFATGSGQAKKTAVIAEAVRRLDYTRSDDNEADALWLQQIGLHLYESPQAVPLPKNHMDALGTVQLPTMCMLPS